MPLYLHTSGERVRTRANSHEDNRLGVAAMTPESGWTLVTDGPRAAEPEPEPEPGIEPAAASKKAAAKGASTEPVEA
jgi:hypothetical protein